MNIIYVNWACFGAEDLVQAFAELGHKIYIMQLGEGCHTGFDAEFAQRLETVIHTQSARLVVSFNYFPTVSCVCRQTGCRYFAWIYDSPYTKVYDKSAADPCNYIGCFDSAMAEEFKRLGIDTVHYVPLAVNTDRVGRSISGKRYFEDIAFVGSLYNEKSDFYSRLFAGEFDQELKGYIDGVVNAQLMVYGYNFMEECLTAPVIEKIRQRLPYNVEKDSYITEARVYADYYLARRLAYLERIILLTSLADRYSVSLYTYETDQQLGNVKKKGVIDYFREMPQLFSDAKINLNITLRSIRNGIPLRAMDIMGAGGFLLTNYQADMFRHFEPDRHFTYYTSIEEAVDKAGFYLRHEKERERIARNAGECIREEHSYKKRIQAVLKEIEKQDGRMK